jgi:hypothetical protein
LNRLFIIITGASFSCLGFSSEVAGQTEAGFFSIANAVDLKTNTLVSVDGKPLRPDGIKPAKVTGGLGFPAGTHRIDASNADRKPASLSLNLSSSVSPIVIIYSVETRTASGQVSRELRLFPRQNRSSASGKTFSVIYVGSLPSIVAVLNGQPKTLQPLQEVALGNIPSIAVAYNGQQLASFAPDVAGSYLLVLFDSEGSRLAALLADDIIFKAAGKR